MKLESAKPLEQLQVGQSRSLTVAEVKHRFVRSRRDHAGGQNHQIGLEDHVFAQQGVVGVDPQLAAVTETHFGDLRLGEHDAGITLYLLIEELRLPRGADVLVEDHGRGVGVAVPHIQGLLQGGRAAEVGAVGQMVRVPGTGALDEGDRFGGFAVGGPDDLAALAISSISTLVMTSLERP